MREQDLQPAHREKSTQKAPEANHKRRATPPDGPADLLHLCLIAKMSSIKTAGSRSV